MHLIKPLTLAVACALPGVCHAVPPVLLSHTSAGGVANGAASDVFASDDLRWVAFTSTATDLDPGDTSSIPDVYLADAQTGAVKRISIDPVSGNASNTGCYARAVSGDGRSVVMACWLYGLDPAVTVPTNRLALFVYERDADGDGILDEPGAVALTLISRETNGQDAEVSSMHRASISSDGRFVTYQNGMGYTNHPECGTPSISGSAKGLWLLDRDGDGDGIYDEAGAVTRSCPGPNGASQALISGDGTKIAFETYEALDPADTNASGYWGLDVYVLDVATGVTKLVSIGDTGHVGSIGVANLNDISADGDTILFTSNSSSLQTSWTNNHETVYVRRVAAGTTEHIAYEVSTYTHATLYLGGRGLDLSPDGALALLRIETHLGIPERDVLFRVGVHAPAKQFKYGGEVARVAADGQAIAYLSADPSHAPGDANGVADAFIAANAPDLEITIDSNDPVPLNFPGSAAHFFVNIRNVGSASSETSTVVIGPSSNGLPQYTGGMQNFSCASPGGYSIACTIPVLAPGEGGWWRMDLAPLAFAPVEITATATSAPHDVDPSNDVAVKALAVQAATDLAVTLSMAPPSISVGRTTTAIVRVDNLGSMFTATNVTVRVYPPPSLPVDLGTLTIGAGGSCDTSASPWICVFPSLGPNASAEIRFTIQGTTALISSVNATVSSDLGDPSGLNNAQAIGLTVMAPPPPPPPDDGGDSGDGGGTGGGGGGGGSSDPLVALGILALALGRRFRR